MRIISTAYNLATEPVKNAEMCPDYSSKIELAVRFANDLRLLLR